MTNKDNTSELVRCFIDVIVYMKQLCLETGVELRTISNNLNEKLRDSAELSLQVGIDIREYDNARFAVCALLDEQLMSQKWQYQELWKDNLLQQKYYDTNNAGSEFYDRLSQLELSQTSEREVYVLCLVLGFCGKFSRIDDINSLRLLRDEELSRLEVASPVDENEARRVANAFPKPKLNEATVFGLNAAKKFSVDIRCYWIFTPIVLIFVWVIYVAILNYQSLSLTTVDGLK